jgi:hypothetical protein
MANAVHRTHSYRMYREFVSVGAVDEEKLKTLTTPVPAPGFRFPSSGYDMPARLRQIGNAESNFAIISELAAGACIFNAIAIFLLSRKRPEPTVDLP